MASASLPASVGPRQQMHPVAAQTEHRRAVTTLEVTKTLKVPPRAVPLRQFCNTVQVRST